MLRSQDYMREDWAGPAFSLIGDSGKWTSISDFKVHIFDSWFNFLV